MKLFYLLCAYYIASCDEVKLISVLLKFLDEICDSPTELALFLLYCTRTHVYACTHAQACNKYTVVSWTSTHSRMSTIFHGISVAEQLTYGVSAHAGQNHELRLSAHGCLPWTLRYMYMHTLTLTLFIRTRSTFF